MNTDLFTGTFIPNGRLRSETLTRLKYLKAFSRMYLKAFSLEDINPKRVELQPHGT
jgi:hypothetical protein